jgi:hypothetical protein
MSNDDWSDKVIKQTKWAAYFISQHFNRQVENLSPVAFAIKTDLSLFDSFEFEKAIAQKVHSGVKIGDIMISQSGLKKLSADNISLWMNHLSKIDRVRQPPLLISQESFPYPILTIQIVEEPHGITPYENVEFPHQEGRLIVNCKFAIFCGHVLDILSNLNPATERLRKCFVSEEKFGICKELLEECDITLSSIPSKEIRLGKLTAAIDAMKHSTQGFFKPNYSEKELLSILNDYLGTNFATYDKRSKVYKDTYNFIAKPFLVRRLQN